jgi:glycosyltransferase involved in cell wall biosynthesis
MISFVIPLKNEVENLDALHQEISSVVQEKALGEVEFFYIDDGSSDGSWQVVEDLARRDNRVRGIKFRRNFGKAAGLTAGFDASKGEIVFTLDGDLQDDPIEIPRFLAKLDEGFDLVSGWKKRRHDPWHKVGPSRVFNWLVSSITKCQLHDHNCGYKAYRRVVLDHIRIYGELHRFVPALAFEKGFRVGEIEVHHRARRFGVSKYGVSRFIKGLFDLFSVRFTTRYQQRPQHIMGAVGLAFLGVGLLGLLALFVGSIMGWSAGITLVPAILAGTLVVIGFQFLGLGLVSELVTSYQLDEKTTYNIAAKVGFDQSPPSIS